MYYFGRKEIEMVSKQDKQVLQKQLGRTPRNIVEIVVKCSAGFPQVFVTAPILNDSDNIFPTTFWLSCPELNYRIAKLEDQGFVRTIKEKIDQDLKLKSRLKQAHQDYATYRTNLMSSEQLEELKDKNEGQYRVIKESGVGGIMDFAGIKCLHTHYAHYLVDANNPVGELVEQLLETNYSKGLPDNCQKKCEVEG
ncbi:MAG: DUF501 domain-containing protein [Bacillota bacterium]